MIHRLGLSSEFAESPTNLYSSEPYKAADLSVQLHPTTSIEMCQRLIVGAEPGSV